VLIAIAAEALATAALVLPLALAVNSALVPTLLIPLALYVRWYFVPQVVVVEKTDGTEALRSSWRLTRGSGFRVFGILFLATLLIGIAAQVVATPLLAAAQGADSGALLMLYQAMSQAIASPVVAILAALLYFDLRSRRRAVA
jgi:membrane-anchored glycerophosphoryl diester phosphodiesterase (GDPDase)